MCGIVAILGNGLDNSDIALFTQSLFTHELRGEDSTGIFEVVRPDNAKQRKFIDNGGSLKAHYIKKAEPVSWFLKNKSVASFLKYGPRYALVGHTRAATMGAINDENAHPFNTTNVLGVVNGTVSKYEIPDHAEYETDSEAMINLLSEKGKKEGLEILTGLSKNPFAMVFFDKRDNTINFIRSGSVGETRPLWAMRSQDQKRLIFASEPEFVSAVGYRTNYNMDTDYGYKTGALNELWTFEMSENDFILSPKVSLITPKERPKPVYQTTHGKGGGYRDSGNFGNFGYNESGVDWHDYVDGDDIAMAMSMDDDGGIPEFLKASPVSVKKGEGLPGRLVPEDTKRLMQSKENPTDTPTSISLSPPKIILPDGVSTPPWEVPAASPSSTIPKLTNGLKGSTAFSSTVGRPSTSNEGRIFYGPNGALMSSAKYARLLKQGCANCSAEPDINADGVDMTLAWFKTDAGNGFFCNNCRDLPYAKELGVELHVQSKH